MPFETRCGDFTMSDDLQRFDLPRAHGRISDPYAVSLAPRPAPASAP